jgi:O-antigen ligase
MSKRSRAPTLRAPHKTPDPGRRNPARRPAAAARRAAARDFAAGAAELLLWALVLVPPLFVVPTAMDSFRLPKLLLSSWLALASLLPLSWVLARAELSWREIWRLPALRVVGPPLLLATLGLAVTEHPVHVRSALPELWIGAACLVGWSAGLSARRLARPLAGLLIPASALALLGVFQFHGLYRPLHFFAISEAERLGVTSLAGNPADLGAYLVLPCLVAPWCLARARSRPVRWGAAAALALCLYALAATQTLAALAGLAAGALVYGLLVLPRRWSLALLAGGLVTAGLLAAAVPPLRGRLVEKARQVAAADWNAVLTGRLDGWQAAVWMVERHPWTGVGHGAFAAEYVPAKRDLLARGASFYARQTQPMFTNAHNEALEVAATWGLPGLAALLWSVTVLAASARRIGAGAAHDRALAWAGLAALAVVSLAHFPFRIALVGYPALLFLAWLLRRSRSDTPPPGLPPQGGEGRSRGTARSRLASARLAAALLGLAVAVGLAGQTVRLRDRIHANRLLRQVQGLTVVAANSGRLSPRLLAANLEVLRRAAALDPTDVQILTTRGGQYMLLHRPEAALAAYGAALALEPRPEIHLNLGRAYAEAGRLAEARRQLEITRQLDPHLYQRAVAGR